MSQHFKDKSDFTQLATETHLSLRFDTHHFAVLYNNLLNGLVQHVGSSVNGT